MEKKYIKIAKDLAAKKSKEYTKVGCVIIKDDKIISAGWNKMPRGMDKDEYDRDFRRDYVIHAEASAILQRECRDKLNGAELYVTMFPCKECAKLITQVGIQKVYYTVDYINRYWMSSENVAQSKLILQSANIKTIHVK